MEFVVEKLTRAHDRTAFGCGDGALDEFIQRYAMQQQRGHYGTTWVLRCKNGPTETISYFTMCSGGLERRDIADLVVRAPYYVDLPVTMIGRLAVDVRHAGRGYGARTLAIACTFALSIAKVHGSCGVVVDAKTPAVVPFYERHGFTVLPDSPRRLFASMKSISRAATPAYLAMAAEALRGPV